MTDAEAGRTRDFLGYGRRPPDPRWPNGAHVAVNFVINYEEGGEYSVPDDYVSQPVWVRQQDDEIVIVHVGHDGPREIARWEPTVAGQPRHQGGT